MADCAGPLTITAERFKTFTRYQLDCACGWGETTDDLSLFLIKDHLRRACSSVEPPKSRKGQSWTAEEDAQPWSGSTREVAERLGRSMGAVATRRLNLRHGLGRDGIYRKAC